MPENQSTEEPSQVALTNDSVSHNDVQDLTVDPKAIVPPYANKNCWRLTSYDVVQPQPLYAPTPFFYAPFEAAWTGDFWNATMDHGNPNYTKNKGISSLGEILTDDSISSGNFDMFYSPSLEINFAYDGHDGNDFGVTGHALAVASGV